MPSSAMWVLHTSLLIASLGGVDSHGYLKSPRARNFLAYEFGVWSGGGGGTYPKESCPHCANRGGVCGNTGGHSYDIPLNVNGGIVPADPQATYAQGQEIELDLVLSAHHKGHFEFNACPISDTNQAPTTSCFQQYPLEFVSDPLYGAVKDVNYPNRAYIAPTSLPGLLSDSTGVSGSLHRFRMKLPATLEGNLVVLQWHYKTANSCIYPGYTSYPFPSHWGPMLTGVGTCPATLDPTGATGPEQFWNCAEISISSGPVSPTTPSPVPPPSAPTTPAPYPTAPTAGNAPPLGDCGNGFVGNGQCPNPSECCSQWGWCDNTPAHCNTTPIGVPQSPQPTPAPVTASTPAPVTAAPVPATGGSDWTTWVVSTSSRCGSSELDARGQCRATCNDISDCAAGQWCWSVQQNFCGVKPQPNPNCNSQSSAYLRCGVSEIHARETCGASCTHSNQCAIGESCFGVHANYCDCQRRLLRGQGNDE